MQKKNVKETKCGDFLQFLASTHMQNYDTYE